MTVAGKQARVAVAIPCYGVSAHILDVLARIPACVERVYVVDDACPEHSGALVQQQCADTRVQVIFHAENQGVGGAVVSAYRAALEQGMDIVVKLDGDGQMNPALLPRFIRPIIAGRADYTKGNRFFRPESLRGMPRSRLLGNAGLSFLTKISTGYWQLMDPTNGYTAIHAKVLRELPLEKLERRFFFESDMLFHLNILRAVAMDIPMDAVYGQEKSSLRIGRVLPEFAARHVTRMFRRYAFNYLVRDFNIGSIYSIFGLLLFLGGVVFGLSRWIGSFATMQPATSGTVMLAALPVLMGMQLLIAFIQFDISNVPREPLIQVLPDHMDDV